MRLPTSISVPSGAQIPFAPESQSRELLTGTIRAQIPPGEGTTFTFDGTDYLLLQAEQHHMSGPFSPRINELVFISGTPATHIASSSNLSHVTPVRADILTHRHSDKAGPLLIRRARLLIPRSACTGALPENSVLELAPNDPALDPLRVRILGVGFCEHPAFFDVGAVVIDHQ